MKVHHVGYLVSDMESALGRFISMGAIVTDRTVYDEDRLVDIAFIKFGNMPIELVCPREDSTAVGKSLRKLRNTPYHLCFECADLEEEVKRQIESGCMLVIEPQRAVAIGGHPVAFLYSEEIGLFELVELPEHA